MVDRPIVRDTYEHCCKKMLKHKRGKVAGFFCWGERKKIQLRLALCTHIKIFSTK
jgi:hypothetical protein